MIVRTAISCNNNFHIQTAIIGAGVIGLSVARALSKKGHEILLLEQYNTIGSGISSRNSEVVHAGIYYEKNTLKSKLCVEGKKMIYQYCKERDIPYNQCGKILVATDDEQRDVGLPQLVEVAKKNGVNDLKVLSKQDVKVLEPNISCTGGVLSPSTGIVDSHTFMTSILADAEENGRTTLALKAKVNGGRIILNSSGERGNIALDVDGSEISCDNVIVCAGLATDRIAASILSSCPTNTDNNTPRIPKQYYAKGNYFKLENQKSPFSRLVYPLPDPNGGLGVHATIDLSNSTRFGPDVEWLKKEIPNDIDVSVDPQRADSFYAAIRKYWPELKDGNLVPDYCGIRPKLIHPNVENRTHLKDFLIAEENYHGVEGLTVLLGIESPGLTSSLSIGNYVAEIID